MNLDPAIDCAFPGGNIILERIEGDTIYLRPDLRDTTGHWFYWNFRIQDAAGRTLRFVFTEGQCIGARGPAVSKDDGANWHWLNASEAPQAEAFSYRFSLCETSLRFCFCLPYTLSNWQTFAQQLPVTYQQQALAKTAQDRALPLIQLGVEASKPLVILTARHHACETTPDFVLEGLLDAWAASKTIGLAVIPFVDMDGVEAGDQGKNRQPHDHNRDYTDDSIYPETKALRAFIEQHPGPVLVLDLHCPYLRGGDSETVYLVGSQYERIATEQARFGELLESCQQGLPYHPKNDVPFGTLWNVEANFTQGKCFATWASELSNCNLATTIEIPYANAEGIAVTPETCRHFGASLAEAIKHYMAVTHSVPCN